MECGFEACSSLKKAREEERHVLVLRSVSRRCLKSCSMGKLKKGRRVGRSGKERREQRGEEWKTPL
jgi:hypothetical protein